MPTGSRDPTPGSGRWLLDDEEYSDWMDEGGILWLKGRAGAGKSTIMYYMLQEMVEAGSKVGSAVLFFFFNRNGHELQRTANGMYRTLLHQLFTADTDRKLLDKFLDESQFASKRKNTGRIGEKWDWTDVVLKNACYKYISQIAANKRVHLFIDALDECNDNDVRSVLSICSQLSTSLRDQVRICIASRPYRDSGKSTLAEGQFSFVIDLQKRNDPDIEAYLQKIFSSSGTSKSKKDLAAVQQHLLQRSQGVFRWVSCVAEAVIGFLKRGNAKYALNMIDGLPDELSDVYATSMLTGISPGEMAIALRLLEWLTFALKPMAIEDLRYAVCLSEDKRYDSIDDLEAELHWTSDDEMMFERASAFSGGMVRKSTTSQLLMPSSRVANYRDPDSSDLNNGADTFTTFTVVRRAKVESKVTFLHFDHESVYRFMEEKGLHLLRDRLKMTFRPTTLESFAITTVKRCTRFLSTKEAVAIVKHKQTKFASDEDAASSSEVRLPPFLMRAVTDWAAHLMHINRVVTHDSPMIDDMAGFLMSLPLDVWKQIAQSQVNIAFGLLYIGVPGNSPMLHTLSRMGVEKILKRILRIGTHSSAPGSCISVDVTTARALINVRDALGTTPLLEAANGGSTEVVSTLLKLGADPKITNHLGQTALHLAVTNGNTDIVRNMLEHGGFNVDARDRRSTSIFFTSVFFGHLDIVKLLMARITDGVHTSKSLSTEPIINLERELVYTSSHDDGPRGLTSPLFTPLQIAWMKGSPEMLKELLKHSEINDEVDESCGFPSMLHMMSVSDPEDVELRALKSIKDIDSVKKIIEQRPKDQPVKARLLIKSGKFDLEKVDKHEWTPLAFAVARGNLASVRVLLEVPAINIGTMDDVGQTPLSLAAPTGEADIVRSLLATGRVNADTRNGMGVTPLQIAVAAEHTETVRVLLGLNDNSLPVEVLKVVKALARKEPLDELFKMSELHHVFRLGRAATKALLMLCDRVDDVNGEIVSFVGFYVPDGILPPPTVGFVG